MAKRIAKNFQEILLDRIDIIDIINSRVPLKKGGKDYQACCPFHNEKTPSFTVSPQKQFFYCFGCGAKGNAISFLMDYEHLSFVDAIEKLAEENGITVDYEKFDDAKAQKRKNLYDILFDVTSLYEKNLFSLEGNKARSYIADRQLDKETISFFRLGYSNIGNNLQKYFGSNVSIKDLQKVGLLSQGDNGVYDHFRDRIMFPIRDHRGRVVAFGARSLGDVIPKYLNSKETDVFSKRYVLYGLYETLKTSRNIESLIVVEGYMDVIALHQNGINGAVASLGTSFTSQHLLLAKKYTKKIFICFDGDNAGKKAANRSIETILPSMDITLDIRFVFLPDGDDPDTLVRKIGKESFSNLLEKGMHFSEFVFKNLIGDSNLNLVEGRGEVVSRSKKLFDNLPDSDYKSLLYQKLTENLGLDIYSLSKKIKNNYLNLDNTSVKPLIVNTDKRYKSGVESRLIYLLLLFPEFSIYVEHLGMLDKHNSRDIRLLKYLVMLFQVNQKRGFDDDNWIINYFSGDNLLRIQEIKNKESIVNDIGAGETIESRKDRLKIDFIDSFNGLFANLSRKIN